MRETQFFTARAQATRIRNLAMRLALLGLLANCYGQPVEQILKTYGSSAAAYPYAGLVQGGDGTFYGTTQNGGTSNQGTVFKLNSDGTGFTNLHSFTGTGGDGSNPQAPLMQGRDGMLYGTTSGGGTYGHGTVFKLNTDGTHYTSLYSFGGTGGDGASPAAGLVQGTDGALYGTAQSGGTHGLGTVFKLNTDGTGHTNLYSFTGSEEDGASPQAGLVQGRDGALYGTTYTGGYRPQGIFPGIGVVFKLNTNGTGYAVIHIFTGGDGANPQATLVQGSDGALYGTSVDGGAFNEGTVFKLNTDSTGFTNLYSFGATGEDGTYPFVGLMQASDGALYGATYQGGPAGYGTVFKLHTDGTVYTNLYSFSGVNVADGGNPQAVLVQGTDGALYGTASIGGPYVFGTVFKINTDGTGYTTLYSFGDASRDGAYPYGLLQGRDGVLYGTTGGGGINGNGTVFKLNTEGNGYTNLHRFAGADGRGPQAALVQALDGALYGTCSGGGTYTNGTVFKLNTDGTGFTNLYNFTGAGADGAYPYGLLQGRDGVLYGTTANAGTYARGTVFKLNTDGTGYSILHAFNTSGGDGSNPQAGLVHGSDGALYGTTANGGTANYGMVFKLNTDGTGYTNLHNFNTAGSNGRNPQAGLVQGSDSALYGTTANGGTANYGMVFKLNTDGSGFTNLHSFTATGPDGDKPLAGLLQGSDGALYGTTLYAGIGNYGMVFKLNTDGTGFTNLHSFTGADGHLPSAGLVQGSDGAFYGTTVFGGTFDQGILFRLLMPPFKLQIARLPDRNVWLSTLTVPNATLELDGSTNLLDWTALTNITGLSGTVQFNDLKATNYTRRFYRALWIP